MQFTMYSYSHFYFDEKSSLNSLNNGLKKHVTLIETGTIYAAVFPKHLIHVRSISITKMG